MNKQFKPKKVVIYGEDGDRVELNINPYDLNCEYEEGYYYEGELIDNITPKRTITISNIRRFDYYVKRAGKRYRKNRRGYR